MYDLIYLVCIFNAFVTVFRIVIDIYRKQFLGSCVRFAAQGRERRMYARSPSSARQICARIQEFLSRTSLWDRERATILESLRVRAKRREGTGAGKIRIIPGMKGCWPGEVIR